MSALDLQQSMSDDDRVLFKRGAELLSGMQAGKLFDDHWVPVGNGLLAVRRTVMKALHLSKPQRSGHYNEAFGRLCAKTPYANLHKVERANLLYCMEHLADIMEMRAAWTPSERTKINHPTSMAKRLREFFNRGADEPPRRNWSPMAAMKDKNDQLMRANLDLADQLAAAEHRDGSLFDLKRDKPEDIARAIAANVTTHKARAIYVSLGRAIEKPKPAG